MLTCKKELTSQPCQNGRMKIKVGKSCCLRPEIGIRKLIKVEILHLKYLNKYLYGFLQWDHQTTNTPIFYKSFTKFLFQRTSDHRRETFSSRISLTTIPGRRRLSCSPRVTRPPGRRSGGGTCPACRASRRTRPGPRRSGRQTGTPPPPCRPWPVSRTLGECGISIWYTAYTASLFEFKELVKQIVQNVVISAMLAIITSSLPVTRLLNAVLPHTKDYKVIKCKNI